MEAAADGGGGTGPVDGALTGGDDSSAVDQIHGAKGTSVDQTNNKNPPKLNNNSSVDDMTVKPLDEASKTNDASLAIVIDEHCAKPHLANTEARATKKFNCENNGKVLDSSLEMMESNDNSANGKRRRHRRKQKGGKHHPRRWKPYDKLTWDEKKVLEERECRRACQKRESRFASGQAMAPYNTTQFLMEQHEPEESELHLDEQRPIRDRTASHRNQGEHHIIGVGLPPQSVSGGSGEGSSEEYYDSNEEEIFLEKDFTEAYEQYQAEKLQSMTKDELVKDYMGLECEVEQLRQQVKTFENSTNRNSSESGSGSQPPTPQVGRCLPLFPEDKTKTARAVDLQLEIQKLRSENESLVVENARLRKVTGPNRLAQVSVKDSL